MKKIMQNLSSGRSEIITAPAPSCADGAVLIDTRVSLISAGTRSCPECGAPNAGEFIPVTPWRLTPKDAAKVSEYRQRKWGISGAPGPLVEAFRRVA